MRKRQPRVRSHHSSRRDRSHAPLLTSVRNPHKIWATIQLTLNADKSPAPAVLLSESENRGMNNPTLLVIRGEACHSFDMQLGFQITTQRSRELENSQEPETL